MRWLEAKIGRRFVSYDELWRWSVTELESFWATLWEYFDVRSRSPYERVLSSRAMPGAEWFPGATLNYAEHSLRYEGSGTAVLFRSEDGRGGQLTRDALRDAVVRARAGLSRLGVRRGDRVAAILPNGPEAVIAFLATASLGAIWSCAAPEFGVEAVLDRFRQIAPKVLIGVDGYLYGGKAFERSAELEKIAQGLPSTEHVVLVSKLGGSVEGSIAWSELLATPTSLEFEAVPFAHPLWILYSSGTTGLPKPIVQGHGGILLEHLKALALHCDLGEKDRFFWFSTTGWMMWNFLVSGLTVGATIVLYDGNPGHPDLSALYRFADEERVTYFGTSASFLLACKKAAIVPKKLANLDALRAIGSTGSPLPSDGFEWVYDNVKRDVLLGSIAGGTDVCTAFVGSCPLLAVHSGEIQCRALGAKVEAFDDSGRSLLGEVGELVVTEPMPSMPLYFWNDPDGTRLRESYYSEFPGVWRHGDWIRITPRGSCVIYGRSDSTLNRGGVRMGTAEFYRVVEALPDVLDCLVVDTGSLEREGKLWLFVVPVAPTLGEDAIRRIRSALRASVSPRHVPDEIIGIHDVPRTLSGKKLEVPVKRILMGVPPERAVNPGTLANPDAMREVLDAARLIRGN